MANRWWVYQRERFPLLVHGPLIFAFSFCAVSYSSLLRGEAAGPAVKSVAVAFVTSLLFFLKLRIADEFKDFEEDSRYRPYRAVPRGLVTLRELGYVGLAAAAVQLVLALCLQLSLVFLLLIPWLYLALMTKDFFVRKWIINRPFTYMWTHMMIMPLIDLYATSCDWHLAGSGPPKGLVWFLAVSYFNGVVVEIGRKVRAPPDEEVGVTTYSAVWGLHRAVFAWLTAIGLNATLALVAAHEIHFLGPMAVVLFALIALAIFVAWRFLKEPTTNHSKRVEAMSGVWTLLMYLSLGAAPLLLG